MASRHLLRSLPGHLAFVLVTLIAVVTAVTAVGSYFYEGWGQPIATAARFLAPPVVLIGLGAIAFRRPWAGGILFVAAGLGMGTYWLWRPASTGNLTSIVVQTAVVFFVPALLVGSLFLLEARHRRLLDVEGDAQASRRWWTRNYRLVLLIGLPLIAVAAGPARQLPDLLGRYDDGLRGARTIAGNGVTLVWAPQGPGWNWGQADGGYLSWTAVNAYGSARTDLCGYLSEDGTSLQAEPIRAWRLPTADEVIRSLTRGGGQAGCTWDGRSSHATCARPPDKETPLWAPDAPPIYYLTSDTAGDQHALGVNYTGGITPHRRDSTGASVSYRCVRAVQ